MRVDVGVFAHNESAGIARMVMEIERQDFGNLDVSVLILANGCSDDTASNARSAATSDRVEVVELPEGGKSRTWNRFVHDLSRPASDVLVFIDADITIPPVDGIKQLIQSLQTREHLFVINSHPIKDIVYQPQKLGLLDRLIAMSSGTLDDWQTSICGQLYAMPAPKARLFHLPIGLPVEDGFLRALVLTDGFQQRESLDRIDGEEVFHIFTSERSVASLIRHQTRIVIGSAVNMAVFEHLHKLPNGTQLEELSRAAASDKWLPGIIQKQLPRWPFGWVPFHFLTKRIAFLSQQPRQLLKPRCVLVMVLGFGFDLIVYVIAQFRMARGSGAGYW